MAISTPNLNLVKPEITDKIDVSIAHFAQNADKVDAEAKRLQDKDQALQASLDDTKQNVAGLQNDVTTMNQKVTNNRTALERNSADIRVNADNITKSASDIAVLNESIASMQGSLDNTAAIGQENQSNITAILSEIEAIKDRLAMLESKQETPPSEGGE